MDEKEHERKLRRIRDSEYKARQAANRTLLTRIHVDLCGHSEILVKLRLLRPEQDLEIDAVSEATVRLLDLFRLGKLKR